MPVTAADNDSSTQRYNHREEVTVEHRIRVRTYRWREGLTLAHLERIVEQINEKAQNRRMIGQIYGAGLNDGKSRISHASHYVMPTAKLQGSSILVDVDILTDCSPGRTVAAFLEAGLQISGALRAVGSTPADMQVMTVDIDLSTTHPEETILDDIVDALEASDVEG